MNETREQKAERKIRELKQEMVVLMKQYADDSLHGEDCKTAIASKFDEIDDIMMRFALGASID